MSNDDHAADRPVDPAVDPADRPHHESLPALGGHVAAPQVDALPAEGPPAERPPADALPASPLPEGAADQPTESRVGRSAAKQAKGGSFLRELPVLVVIALGLAILIKAFVVQAFYIPSGSMEQTLALNDRVLVNKVIYHLRDIKRGEIVVFNGEGSFGSNPEVAASTSGNPIQQAVRTFGRIVGFGPPGERDFIKRVIGIPGDRVACCTNGHVTVQRADSAPTELIEPYVYEDDKAAFCAKGSGPQDCPPGAPGVPASPGVLVPAGRLWVMGDHRGASSDSRLHRSIKDGTIPQDQVIGRAFVIVWPLDRFTGLHRPDTSAGSKLVSAASLGLGASPYLLGLAGAVPIVGLRRRRRLRDQVRPAAADQ